MLSDFIESVDDMIAREGAFHALRTLRDSKACSITDWKAANEVLYHLILGSIAHSRRQLAGRWIGEMTFDEAMQVIRLGHLMVTRPNWNIFHAVRFDEDGSVGYWVLDNGDGDWSGFGRPYHPTDEDRAASDWMRYQAPQECWVEFDL